MLSVGEILRKERERKGFSLVYVEKAIKIREKFLRAVEENKWGTFPSYIYISGIIKNYASFLQLDQKKMLAFFRREYEMKEDMKFKRKASRYLFTSQTKRIVVWGIGLLFFFFALYFGYQLKLYFQPPQVLIVSPKETKFFTTEKITIIGRTDKEATIMIFGEHVYPDKNGTFQYLFPLKKGKNDLIIEVTGANGRKTMFRKEFNRG